MLGLVVLPLRASAQDEELPDGFSFEPVGMFPSDAGSPVGFAFLPDGRFVIIERETGNLRIQPASPSSTSVIHQIPDVEAALGERGLLGVAVDPAGPGSVLWDGRAGDGSPVPAGVYFYRADGCADRRWTGRIVLLR